MNRKHWIRLGAGAGIVSMALVGAACDPAEQPPAEEPITPPEQPADEPALPQDGNDDDDGAAFE